MSEKKNETFELNEEELEKVSGGIQEPQQQPSLLTKFYCPDCDYCFGFKTEVTPIAGLPCPICKRWVEPIEK